MINISEIRKKYPQYQDLSDEQLIGSLHKKYYSDIPIEEFRSKVSFEKKQKELSGLEKAVKNPITQGILGAGDELRNLIASGANLIPGVKIPYSKSGEGLPYEVGKLGGGISGFIGGGAPLGAIKGLSKIPGAIKRAAGMGAFGALEKPEHRLEGAAEGAAISAAIDALPLPFKIAGKVAESMNPAKFTKFLAEDIHLASKKANEKAKELYKPVKEQYGKVELPLAEPESGLEYLNIDKNFVDRWYGTKLRKLHDEFLRSPTLDNAHKLQSQMGKKIGEITSKRMDSETYDVVESLRYARDVLQKDADKTLQSVNKEASEMYKKASDVYKNEYIPFSSNPTLRKISKGEVKTINPKVLEKSLLKAKESGAFNDEHYLSKALEQMSSKINKGKAIKDITSIAGGSAIGDILLPGIGGIAAGGLLGKFLGPNIIDLSTNPEFIKTLSKLDKLRPYGQKGGSALLVDGMKNGKNGK